MLGHWHFLTTPDIHDSYLGNLMMLVQNTCSGDEDDAAMFWFFGWIFFVWLEMMKTERIGLWLVDLQC